MKLTQRMPQQGGYINNNYNYNNRTYNNLNTIGINN